MTRGGREAFAVALVVLGSLAATVGILANARPSGRTESGDRKRLAFDGTSRACEGCHPRHTAEWRRSVMAHASRSPLFQSLEMLIEEAVGLSSSCPEGAGVLRRRGGDECRDPATGQVVTGSGGEGWCVSCHAPGENLGRRQPSWSASGSLGRDNRPLRELLSPAGLEGIGCTACHQVHGPVTPGALARGGYEGNPIWTSFESGQTFSFRPTAGDRRFGISNSGYRLEPSVLLAGSAPTEELVAGGAHRRLDERTRDYLGSSEFCGSCHDVRLFGTDILGVAKGEHFKRLRNAYSEWLDFKDARQRQGRDAPSCQACHMSNFPGLCVKDDGRPERQTLGGRGAEATRCPPGTRFAAREPGDRSFGTIAAASSEKKPVHPHYFTGVDVPLSEEFDEALANEQSLDAFGIPLGARFRRDLLLASAVRLELGALERRRGILEIPVTIENVGGGHRVPAGFSQERELWVHLTVKNELGRVLYEVGRVERDDDDLRDKVFLRVTTNANRRDGSGRPLGLFGADVVDGPDVPRWDPPPELGGRRFRGRGLINFQNGFLRCVRCVGRLGPDGRCEALPGQERRADRFDDGVYDLDTGNCTSNLAGRAALFETYFPVGALDATRGLTKAPDAIIDTRSLAPESPVTYVYELPVSSSGAISVEARLLFRAFPPYLVRAFAAYEREQVTRGKRERGPLVTERMLERLDVVEIARAERRGG